MCIAQTFTENEHWKLCTAESQGQVLVLKENGQTASLHFSLDPLKS